MRTAWFAVMLTASLHAQQFGRVEGRVVSSLTGEPIRKVTVRLVSFGEGDAQRHHIDLTGDDGSFTLPDLPFGTYQIGLSKTGFNFYDTRKIIVADGQPAPDLNLAMTPLATISGKVTDSAGDPVPNARVTLFRPFLTGQAGAIRDLRRSSSAIAGQRGEFNFPNLPADRYYVQADDSTGESPLPTTTEIRTPRARLHALPTYYPSELSPSRARPIELVEGAEARNIDIRLHEGPIYSVSGRMVAADGGKLSPSTQVYLASAADPLQALSSVYVDREGRFTASDLPQGRYQIRASEFAGVKASGHSGSMDFDLNEDIDDLTFVVQPNFDVSARAILDGSDTPLPFSPYISLIDVDLPRGWSRNPDRDGTLVFSNVNRGNYAVGVNSLPPNIYFKTVLSSGRDLSSAPLDFTGGPPADPIEIVLAEGAGRITGPWPAAVGPSPTKLLLWPKTAKPYRSAGGVYAASGRAPEFEIFSIPPGDYYLAAFEGLPQGFTRSHSFLSRFNDAASAITLAPGQHIHLEPNRIPSETVKAALASY